MVSRMGFSYELVPEDFLKVSGILILKSIAVFLWFHGIIYFIVCPEQFYNESALPVKQAKGK